MFGRLNTFTKVMAIIVLLLAAMIALYSYSNRVSSRLVEEQLIQSNFNRISVFLDQMDSVSEQIWRSAYTTMQDEHAVRLQSQMITRPSFESIITRGRMENLMRQQTHSLPWEIQLTLYAPANQAVVTTAGSRRYDTEYFETYYSQVWTYRVLTTGSLDEPYFVRHITRPFIVDLEVEQMDLILEAAIPASKLAGQLTQLQTGAPGVPLLYHPEQPPITSPDADAEQISVFLEQLRQMTLADEGYEMVRLGSANYLMNYAKSESFGWHLVDFIPLESIMQPIRYNMKFFYITTGLLLLFGLGAAALVYRNVQMPIHQLTRGVQRIARGEYLFRVSEKKGDEFAYLFSEFNAMSDEIQRLIEKVYFEQINVREAKLRQMQSQINPHFLYNNFNFIQSMTQLGNKAAVIACTQHLSHYYRYTTRTGNSFCELREELELVRSYLEIHKMQMGRLSYHIDVPSSMLNCRMPRLLLQPVVENAIVHGIENRLGEGCIRITGSQVGGVATLVVEDNGVGMREEQLQELRRRLDEEAGGPADSGLWNVHQRLKHAYDQRSGLIIARLPEGGLRVELRMETSGLRE